MKKSSKYKMGIRFKITLLIFLVVFTLTLVSTGIWFFWTYNTLRSAIEREHIGIAHSLTNAVTRIINEEVEDLAIHLSNPVWTTPVEKSNLRYENMSAEDKRRYFLEMDKSWAEESDDSPIFKEYLENKLSIRLQRLINIDKDVAEIFLTDKEGGLVASSNKTSYFYQGDEEWWQESFNGGKGKVFLKSVEFDESAKIWAMIFAVPIKDNEGNVIGVCKAILDIARLFAPLEAFKIGETGHAVLVNRNGYIVFHKDTIPLSQKISLKKRSFTQEGAFTATDLQRHKNEILAAFVKIQDPLLLSNKIFWWVWVDQDTDEAFAPLRESASQFLLLAAFFLIFSIPLGYIFGGVLAGSIEKIRQATRKFAEGDLDYRIVLKTGDEIEELADAFNTMIDGLKKTTTSIIVLNKEIRDRKKAEDEVRRAANEWDRSFNAISDFIFIMDKDNIIIRANKAFCEVNKLGPEHIIGRKCFEVLHKADQPWPDCPFERTSKNNKPHTEEIYDPKIGIPLLITTSPIFDKKGSFIGAVHIAKDISKLKEVEKREKEAVEIKSQFISTASHELRTPLTAIKEGISIVADGMAGKINTQQNDFLKMAERNVNRLARLINDILDFQKLEAGKAQFNIIENDINSTVKEACDTMAGLIKEKGLKIILELGKKLPRMTFDRDRIIQVITNLISNAIKFTEKGSITLATSAGDNVVRVSVKDTGLGIKRDDIPRLFSAFGQLEKGKDRKVGGTGLGLAISRDIIVSHHGKIWAESIPGKGTTFSFVLPIKERRG